MNPSPKLVPITADQLLLIDPNAYINLCLMFPCEDPANPPALTLSKNYQLVLIGPREVVLLSRTPPLILRYDKKRFEWVTAETAK